MRLREIKICAINPYQVPNMENRVNGATLIIDLQVCAPEFRTHDSTEFHLARLARASHSTLPVHTQLTTYLGR